MNYWTTFPLSSCQCESKDPMLTAVNSPYVAKKLLESFMAARFALSVPHGLGGQVRLSASQIHPISVCNNAISGVWKLAIHAGTSRPGTLHGTFSPPYSSQPFQAYAAKSLLPLTTTYHGPLTGLRRRRKPWHGLQHQMTLLYWEPCALTPATN